MLSYQLGSAVKCYQVEIVQSDLGFQVLSLQTKEEPPWKESLLIQKDIYVGKTNNLIFISSISAPISINNQTWSPEHGYLSNPALGSRKCSWAHLHIPRSWAVVSPTEDLCHVPEYVHGGQQVPTVAGPILRDFHKVLEHVWQPISHQPTLSFGKVFPGLRNGKEMPETLLGPVKSRVNELSEGISRGRFLTSSAIQSANQMNLTIFAGLRASDIFKIIERVIDSKLSSKWF